MTGASGVVAELKRRGLLPLADAHLPSVAGLVAGEPVRGSWWGHPKGQEIFLAAEALGEHPDAAAARLLGGKVTFVHRALWPALCAVGAARQAWQLEDLPAAARRLLARVDEGGCLVLGRKEPAARDLEGRLLVYGDQFHSETGAHVKRLESWPAWARRVGLAAKKPSVSDARAKLERAAGALWPHAARLLPWAEPTAGPRPLAAP